MIEKGILALMVIFSINAFLIVTGVGGNFNNPQVTLNLLPTGLTPGEVDSSATQVNLVDAGVESAPTNVFDTATALIVDFILSLPLIGTALNVFFTVGGTFLKFLFYWSIVLDLIGLPAAIVFVLKVPLVVFEVGVLFFVFITIIQTFVGVFK